MAILRAGDSVQYLKGVGPGRAGVLAELGIRTIQDLLNHFPRDLAHQPAREQIADCRKRVGQNVTVAGVLERIRWAGRPTRQIFSARLADNSGWLEVVFFNGGWVRSRLGEGDRVVMTGKLRPGRNGPQLANPQFAVQDRDDEAPEPGDRWEPVYPATAKISSRQLRAVLQRNLPALLRTVEDFFPPQYLRRRELLDRWQAYAWMHFPTMDPNRRKPGGSEPQPAGQASADDGEVVLQEGLSGEEVLGRLKAARRRLAWDEAFLFQLALALRRRARLVRLRAAPLPCDDRIRQRILRRFPFALTGAQQRAIDQIAADMARPVPMNRLLQGDVGSGKTAVALFAALLAVAHRRQAAIMAPTELLVDQHHARISQYLAASRVRFGLLTGSLTPAQRRRMHEQLAAGELDLVVGTTALLSMGVRFARLGLVVIDEQHKFGVAQRSGLRDKAVAPEPPSRERPPAGAPDDPKPFLSEYLPTTADADAACPHTLIMTATPIPRSLALTVFGDLAVSVVDELPPGRGRIDTRVVAPANREAALAFIATRLQHGGQAYVVCPRIGADQAEARDDEPRQEDQNPDEGPEQPASAEQAYRELAPRFQRFGVALVHGQMAPERQRAVLADFAAGRVRVLVATTVVEVGVDVARANVMAVLGAEGFGLAQLHQLRGRIGRSSDVPRSYCLLFTDDESSARLAVLEQTRDGFRIAEEDLARRGPGQFFGLAQHGLPEFRHVDLAADLPLLRQARRDAFELVDADPALAAPRHAALKRRLAAEYGQTIQFIDAG